VGWRISSPYLGRGLATEAGRAAVDWGFTVAGLRRIVSIYEPENLASGRVMEHLGFLPYLTTSHPDRDVVVVVTELTRQRWEERQHETAAPSYSVE